MHKAVAKYGQFAIYSIISNLFSMHLTVLIYPTCTTEYTFCAHLFGGGIPVVDQLAPTCAKHKGSWISSRFQRVSMTRPLKRNTAPCCVCANVHASSMEMAASTCCTTFTPGVRRYIPFDTTGILCFTFCTA